MISNNMIDDKSNVFIEGNNIIFQISTTDNVKDNKFDNVSSIDFGECEKTIKKKYNIKFIIIKKTDIKIGENTKVNYELYNPELNNKINLSICNNDKIQIYTPTNISEQLINNYNEISKEGYNILDPNDTFYNDICTKFSSKNGTDMILSDRKAEFFDYDITNCQSGCSYKGVEVETKKVQCECSIEINEDYKIGDKTFVKAILEDSFFKARKFSNFKVITCFKLVFSKKGPIYNIGSYLLSSFIYLFLITQIKYYFDSKELIANLIKKLFDSMNIKVNLGKINKRNFPPKRKAINSINSLKSKSSSTIFSLKSKTNKNSKMKKNKEHNNENYSGTTKSLCRIKKNKDSIIVFKGKKISNNDKNNKNKKNKLLKNKNENLTNKLNDEELNSLKYEEALLCDNRNFKQCYCSLLMKKQLIFFTFCSKNDYNLRMIKFGLFLISLSLYITINSFFFVDENIHKIHEDHGIFNILYQLPKIVYCTIITAFSNFIIKSLALSEKNLLRIKNNKNPSIILVKSIDIFKFLRIKFVIFFFVGFIFMAFCWYFISAFCAVYTNTQKSYLINCASSFAISMAYPFFLNIIPAYLRIYSLRSKKRKCIYTLSSLLALI